MAKKTTAVTSADMQPYQPEGFASLDLPTLHSVADYFGVEKADTPAEQIANFAEDNVTYSDYAKAFKVPLPEDYQEEDAPVTVETEEPSVSKAPVTAERHQSLKPQEEYLIKMTRDNPYFEVASVVNRNKIYRFTQDHPYAIMDAATAQAVLSKEERFRQAFPDELREFYDES
jgi:hypothetical protein